MTDIRWPTADAYVRVDPTGTYYWYSTEDHRHEREYRP